MDGFVTRALYPVALNFFGDDVSLFCEQTNIYKFIEQANSYFEISLKKKADGSFNSKSGGRGGTLCA